MDQISVIIPVYNVEKYLNRCVTSVLAQTYREFELILVDDGSPDNSGALCDALTSRDSRVRVIHKENGGLSSARNAGLDIATGKYVTFIDSDDVIHPCYLECLLKLCAEHDADISMGKLTRFSADAPTEFEMLQQGAPLKKSGIETLHCYFDEKTEVSNFVSACCKLYKRSLFDGLRFPEGRLFEDEFTTYRLYYRAQKVVISDSILYYYYENDAGITRNLTLRKRCDEYDAQWERICFFREKHLQELWGLALRQYLATAQWDLRESYKTESDPRITAFQRQFRTVLRMAQEAGHVHFLADYDYFVLAYPKRVLPYRILRQIKLRRR